MVLCCSSPILSRPNYLRDPLGYYGFTQIQSKLYSLLATLSYLFYFWCAVIFFFAILLLHNRFLSISKKRFHFGRWSGPRLVFWYFVIYTSSEVCILDVFISCIPAPLFLSFGAILPKIKLKGNLVVVILDPHQHFPSVSVSALWEGASSTCSESLFKAHLSRKC